MLDWRDMDRGAPELARLAAARLAMLGPLRRAGSPRISPVEPCIVDGQLLVGAMTWSGKAADLRQDPRYVLHSVVSGPDSGQGELKLYGLAVEADPGLRGAAEAWWSAHPPGKAVVFSLRRAGDVRRLGHRPWRDDGPPMVSATRLQPPDPHLSLA
jgi:hypothetical protein